MRWHRADGASSADDGIDGDVARRVAGDPRRRVLPLELGPGGALARGAVVGTLGAALAAVLLLLGLLVVGIVDEDVFGAGVDLQLLLRGAIGSLLPLTVVAAVGEPIRLAAERALQLRAAERAEDRTMPPVLERDALDKGHIGVLRGLGIGLAIAGGLLLPLGIALATDDREALLARILLPGISGAWLLGGILLAWAMRRRGGVRARWAERSAAVMGRWTGGVRSVPRAHRQRRFRVLNAAGAAVGVGAFVFFGGVFMRQPGRFAEQREYDDAGERAIDGLLLTGTTIMAVAVVVLLLGGAVLIAWAAIAQGRAVRALERGERVRLEVIDAIILDDSPLERVAWALGVAAWLVLALGWAPGWAGTVESAERAAPLRAAEALIAPGIAGIALAWLLGSVGAWRSRRRRARIHAVLARNPRPAEDSSAPTDRRAGAVRDIALHADRSGS